MHSREDKSAIRESTSAYKYAQIKSDLSVHILNGALQPNERIPSLNQITERYGVSKITARRVLTDLVAEGLVYSVRGRGSFVAEPNSSGVGLVSPSSDNVGVLLDNASSPFMSELIRGIDEEVFQLGGHINLCLSNDCYDREAELLNRLVDQGTKRILLFMVLSDEFDAPNPNVPLYIRLQEQGVRLLLMDCTLPCVPIPSVCWDDHGGMLKLVSHLKQRGFRRLGYIGRRNNATTSARRFQGFKDGILEHGLPFDPNLVQWAVKNNSPSFVADAKQKAAKWFTAPGAPDAVVCSDEEVALGVFAALESAPKVKRNRIGVGGFGSAKSGILTRNHTYILLDQDTYLLGKNAAEAVASDDCISTFSGIGGFQKVLEVPMRIPRMKR